MLNGGEERVSSVDGGAAGAARGCNVKIDNDLAGLTDEQKVVALQLKLDTVRGLLSQTKAESISAQLDLSRLIMYLCLSDPRGLDRLLSGTMVQSDLGRKVAEMAKVTVAATIQRQAVDAGREQDGVGRQ